MVKLKNIPEESRDRLHMYLKTLNLQLTQTLNDAMSMDLDIQVERSGVATVEELGTLINSQAIITKMEMHGLDKSAMYLIADITATHVMNGIMILTPGDVIKENIEKGELTESDAETFEELAKNIGEAITTTFESVVSSNYSVESRGGKKGVFKPGIKSLPNLPSDEYLVLTYSFKEEDYPKVSFYLLCPRTVGETIFNCSLEPIIDWSDRTIVLVFDSSDHDRAIIRNVLEKENIGVADFNNHKDILKSISREEVDLIIMEITPNNWDSLMIGKHIRKSTQTKNIPIIFTMRYPTDKVLFLAYKLGIRNFIVKPIKKKSLLKKVNELITDAA